MPDELILREKASRRGGATGGTLGNSPRAAEQFNRRRQIASSVKPTRRPCAQDDEPAEGFVGHRRRPLLIPRPTMRRVRRSRRSHAVTSFDRAAR